MNENPLTKQCSKCKETKPLEMFVASKNRKDGRHSLCIPCNRLRLAEYRKAHPDRIRAAEKKYLAANAHVKAASRRARQERYAELHQECGPSVTEKICPRCNILKPASEFFSVIITKDGLSTHCKSCASQAQKERRKNNPDLYAKYDKERWSKYDKEHQREMHRKWREKNRAKRNAYRRTHHAKRVASDDNYRIALGIRSRIYSALKGIRKSKPTEQIIGCTFPELIKHIESQWEPWMNWRNWGEEEGCWQIDHIVPVSAFDLTDFSQQDICFHFLNLRPLCRKANRSKWDSFDPVEFEALKNRIIQWKSKPS
jgi:hypothetical protein